MKQPSIQALPSVSADQMIANAEAAGHRIAMGCATLTRSRHADAAEHLAIAADGLRRELLRAAQSLRAEMGGHSRA